MTKLKELITRYGNLKTEMDSYKKQVDEDNKAIKELITTEGTMQKSADGKVRYVAEGDGYKVTYTIAVSESFDDEKLVDKLKSIWSEDNGSMQCPYLKMVYVPDMDAIENAIYNGKLDASKLADCRVRKETPKLTISKIKEGK